MRRAIFNGVSSGTTPRPAVAATTSTGRSPAASSPSARRIAATPGDGPASPTLSPLHSIDPHVLDAVLLEPGQERLLLLGQLDLGGVRRVERRDQVEHALVEPLRDLVAGEPVLVLAAARACPAVPGGGHEVDQLAPQPLRDRQRRDVGSVEREAVWGRT